MSHFPFSVLPQITDEKDVEEFAKQLNSLTPFEIADLISEKPNEEQIRIFGLLTPELAAKVFDYLPVRIQKSILYSLDPQHLAKMLTNMPPDDRTALLEELPQAILEKYLKLLPSDERVTALALLGYPEDSVGRLMTTDYIAVKMDWTVQKALDHIREYGHDSETINVIYIINDDNVLLDDIKIREFLFVPTYFKVEQISDRKFVALSVLDNAEIAIQVFKTYDRVALPVIDDKTVLKGIVTIDDVLRYASERSTESIQHVGGTEPLEAPYMETSFFELMKKRAKWLVLLFVGEMFTASAMGYFEHEIAQAVVLALFLPLIISSGGNVGSQSTTLIIRAMALDEVVLSDWWRVFKREIFSGFFLGILLGSIGFARILIWGSVSHIYGEHWFLIALTLFFSLIGVVMWGSLAGAMLPFLLRWLRFDPATASAPLVATLVDVTGIVIYFGIAMIVLKGTLL